MEENRRAKESLSIDKAFSSAINNIVNFSGRARRSEYWWVMLIVCLSYAIPVFAPFGFILSLLTIPLTFRRLHDAGHSGWWWGLGILLNIVCIGLLVWGLVQLIISGTEMEDASTAMIVSTVLNAVVSYLAIFCIAIAYKVLMLVFLCTDSQPQANKYGPAPKYEEE